MSLLFVFSQLFSKKYLITVASLIHMKSLNKESAVSLFKFQMYNSFQELSDRILVSLITNCDYSELS